MLAYHLPGVVVAAALYKEYRNIFDQFRQIGLTGETGCVESFPTPIIPQVVDGFEDIMVVADVERCDDNNNYGDSQSTKNADNNSLYFVHQLSKCC